MVICKNANVIGVKRIDYTNKEGKRVSGALVSLVTPRVDSIDGMTAFVVWHSDVAEARRAFHFPDDYVVTVHKGKFGDYAVFSKKACSKSSDDVCDEGFEEALPF